MSGDSRVVDGVPVDDLGVRFAIVRAIKGWNVKEAAEQCGLAPSTWRNREAGRPGQTLVDDCRRVSERADVSFEWLMVGGPLARSRWTPCDEPLFEAPVLVPPPAGQGRLFPDDADHPRPPLAIASGS